MRNAAVTYRMTAVVLLLVMLVPAFGPFAMANLAPAEGMHCMRRQLRYARAAGRPTRCHVAWHGHVPQDSESQNSSTSTEASLRSLDCCCNHCNFDCCCSVLKISNWARPAASQLSFVSLLIEFAVEAPLTHRGSAILLGPDSARAPPRG